MGIMWDLMKEGQGMRRGVVIAAISTVFFASVLTAGLAAAADDPAGAGGVARPGVRLRRGKAGWI